MYSNRLQPFVQNLLYCLVPPPKIVMHDGAYIGRRSENNIKCIVHDDLGWKNQTTRYILPCHWLYEWFSQLRSCGTYSVLSRSPSFYNCCCVYCVCQWFFLQCSWRCWLGNRKVIWPVKKLGVALSMVMIWLEVVRLIVPVVTATSVIVSSIKIQERRHSVTG